MRDFQFNTLQGKNEFGIDLNKMHGYKEGQRIELPERVYFAETFNWAQTYGTSPGTRVDLGASGNLFNFKNADDATPGNYTSNPITASDTANQGRSYEVWLQAHLTGTFNRIDNLQFWMSTNFSPSTGLTVYWKGNGQTTYATPVNTDSTVATSTVPTADPGTANVSVSQNGSGLTGYLNAAGYSDYIVLQLDVATTAASGDTSLATFTLQYDVQ